MTSQFAATPEELEFAKMSMPIEEPIQRTSSSKSKFAATPEELEFANAAISEPIKEDIPWYQSYFNAAKQGSIQGIVGLGETIGSLINEDPFGESGNQFGQVLGVDTTPKEFQEMKKEKAFKPQTEEERQNLNEGLEERFPANEGFVEGTIKRGTRLAPTSLLGGGGIVGNAARTGAAALAGETAKKLGKGETGQTIAEIAAFASPDLAKILVGKTARQQQMIDLGRRMGLTEEQMAPAIAEENFFRKWLTRVASKGKSTQERLKSSKDALGTIYDQLKTDPTSQQKILKKDIPDVMAKYSKEYFDLPPSLREELDKAFRDLSNSKGTAEDFITFFQHVNYETSDPKRVGKLQEVTRQTLEKISPEIGEDFRLVNELYANVSNLGAKLAPPNVDLVQFTKGLGALYGLFTGNYAMMKTAIGALGGQRLAAEFLLNPRLQNLGAKTIKAINNNQIPIAKKLFDEFREQVKDISPEFYNETADINFDDFNHKSSK